MTFLMNVSPYQGEGSKVNALQVMHFLLFIWLQLGLSYSMKDL